MRVCALLLIIASSWMTTIAQNDLTPKRPETRAQDIVENLHGTQVADPYRWLENQEDPEVRAWIEAQNAYTQAMVGKLPQREKVRKEMMELTDMDSYELPYFAGNRYFYQMRRAKDDLSMICSRKGLNDPDEVLIDPHGMSADHSLSIDLQDVASDGSRLIYGIRKGGEDQLSLRIFDLASKRDLDDDFPRAFYFGATFHPDGKGMVYIDRRPEGPRMYYHTIGAPRSQDKLLFGEGITADKIVWSSFSRNGRHQLITVSEGSSGNRDIYYRATAPDSPIKKVVSASDGWFQALFAGDRLFLQSNRNAPNLRVLEAPLDALERGPEHWPVVIPENPNANITDLASVGGKLFVTYMENVSNHMDVFDLSGKPQGRVKTPGIGTLSGMIGDWERDEGFFSFQGLHVPTTLYHYRASTGETSVWHQPPLPPDIAELATSQVWFTSKDGTRVPMFLVHRKGMALDGNNPTMLYGYGGFRASIGPTFSTRGLVWARHGGIYAMVNLRGGAEFGESWHQAGMMDKKQNTFDDLYAAAEYLVAQKYTRKEKLCVVGGSNGGLLVGAAITQRPELWQAAACLYPLLDMVRFHKFMMGSYWTTEYGSADEPSQFPFIYAYSPYHHVVAGTHYPATIFVTGDADTRVAPLHARKMAAMMQARQGGPAPILLDYDTKAGHVGGGSRDHAIANASLWMGFLMDQLGMQ